MSARSQGGRRPVGRRPGDPSQTRATILAAARRQFAERGYERATIRAIAARADVDPALVLHHFGSKQRLFAAAHELPVDPGDLFARIADLPPPERGAAIVRSYLSIVSSPSSPALSLLRAAATHEDAARMLREFVGAAFLVHAPRLAPGPDGARRLALAGAHMVGIVFGRFIVEIEPLASATTDELVELVGPVVQHYLDGAALGTSS